MWEEDYQWHQPLSKKDAKEIYERALESQNIKEIKLLVLKELKSKMYGRVINGNLEGCITSKEIDEEINKLEAISNTPLRLSA